MIQKEPNRVLTLLANENIIVRIVHYRPIEWLVRDNDRGNRESGVM